MPLINGVKMACEPCIRGHRSTKCNHANDRLMVPVRKPGRPLSVCPHPQDQPCGCGGVTAAIPRKQTCRCGNDASTHSIAPPAPNPGVTQLPSPTRVQFRVQKSAPTKKKAFDSAIIEKANPNHANIIQPTQNGRGIHNTLSTYPTNGSSSNGYLGENAGMKTRHNHLETLKLNQATGLDKTHLSQVITNVNTSQVINGIDRVMRNGLLSPINLEESKSIEEAPKSCCAPISNAESQDKTAATKAIGSCCSPKEDPPRICGADGLGQIKQEGADCCSSKPIQVAAEQNTAPAEPLLTAPQVQPHPLMPHGLYYAPGPEISVPQPTMFTYPPTYGSFNNPLLLSAWRQSAHVNDFTQNPIANPLAMGNTPFMMPLFPGVSDTTHQCNCGDGCQCVGCAAHPYNSATQEYVRSAWSTMALDYQLSAPHHHSNGEAISNGNGNGNSNGHTSRPPPQNGDPLLSPQAATPTSTTSPSGSTTNGEEQSLSASDFFFVNYQFDSDGCGGDDVSCPCGDDCQCLGCTIHRPPPLICSGDGNTCLCGEGCSCLGCTLHKVPA